MRLEKKRCFNCEVKYLRHEEQSYKKRADYMEKKKRIDDRFSKKWWQFWK